MGGRHVEQQPVVGAGDAGGTTVTRLPRRTKRTSAKSSPSR